MAAKQTFRGGRNLALKVPPHQFEATVGFYRDVLRLERLETEGTSQAFRFGSLCLWIDRVVTLSQAELWLELQTDDLDAAAGHLREQGVVRCDQIEPLPEGFKGFWITNPAGTIHLVAHSSGNPGL